MKTMIKQLLACALCLAMLLGMMPVFPASAADTPVEETTDESMIIYGKPDETTFVPAGYTYVYESESGQVYTRQVDADVYMTGRVLTAEEAEALAKLEYGSEEYIQDSDGQSLLCREFNAVEAAAYSDAVKEILGETPVTEDDKLSVVYEPYTSQTLVRVLIVFEDDPVIRMDGMSVSLGQGLGSAEQNAVKAIESKQLTILQRAEESLDCEITLEGQFTLLTNAAAVTVPYGALTAIRQTEGVKSAVLMPVFSVPEVNATISDGFELEPNMHFAAPTMGANQAWDVGYKGEGMVVAVLDTGLCYENPAFEQEPADPNAVAYSREDIANILNTNELHAETRSEDTSIDTVYYNSKVPFGFNYADSKADFGTDDDTWFGHGSHVAGIVAGNMPEDLQELYGVETLGLAPEAQLVIMKVFDQRGQCYTDYVISAMEDAIILGVDCANLSLGMDSGPVYAEGYYEIFEAAYDAGINVVVAAGNQAHSGLDSLWGDDMVKSDSISTGTLGMPGTFDSVLTVASVDNSHEMNTSGPAITWYNEKYDLRQRLEFYELDEFIDEIPEGMGFLERLASNSYPYADSFEDAEGKLVFFPLEGNNADDLAAQAAKAKAAGLILILPEDEEEEIEISVTNFDVPMAVTDMSEYKFMLYYLPADGLLRVDGMWNPMDTAGEMSDFSAWGPTESLALKPEIAGIGGGVFSAYYGSYFANSSGTSMASPTVAASAALLRQYLQDNNVSTEEELNHIVNCLLMSTATPVRDEEHDTLYFVRRQGAGLANIGAAMASEAYIRVEGTNKAKLELGDDPEKTGVYEMTFDVVNFSDTDKVYTLDTTVLGLSAVGGLVKGGKVTYLTHDYAREVDTIVTSSLENNTLTVPAGQTASVTVTIALSDAERAYYDERFPAGSYVEGFIHLLSDETPNLSVPFLTFYGDFSDGPIFDATYDSLLGGYNSYNMADQFHSALWGYRYIDGFYNVEEQYYLGETNTPGYSSVPHQDFDSSMDGWAKEFYPEMAGFSPNGDTILDSFRYGLGLRRNVSNIHYTVTNKETGEVLWEQDTGYMPKTYKSNLYAGGELSLEWLYPIVKDDYGFWNYDMDHPLLENNTWVEICADVTLDGEENVTDRQVFSLYIDNDAPMSRDDYTLYVRMPDTVTIVPGVGPVENRQTIYTFESMIREQWFMDYMIDLALDFNEETGKWEGYSMLTNWSSSNKPNKGAAVESVLGTPNFTKNSRRVSFAYDYAGNVSAFEILGGEILDYVDLRTEMTQIKPGDTLTIENVGVAPYNTRLNWLVSDESVAEIVETTDQTVTIKGISNGYVTIYGGFGTYMKMVDVLVADSNYEAALVVMDLIEALPAPEDVTILDRDAIETARAAYEALTEEQKALVENLDKLIACEEALETVKKLPFTDVAESAWYYEAVSYVYHKGIMKGMSEALFAPNSTLTRGQLVTTLYRMDGSPSVEGLINPFTDVTEGSYYTDAVIWAYDNGIVNGVTETTFCPDQPISREQIATILYRYDGENAVEEDHLSQFTDGEKVSAYAEEAMNWAVANGLLNGIGSGNTVTLSAKATATRAQIATIITRFLTKG